MGTPTQVSAGAVPVPLMTACKNGEGFFLKLSPDTASAGPRHQPIRTMLHFRTKLHNESPLKSHNFISTYHSTLIYMKIFMVKVFQIGDDGDASGKERG